MKSINIIEFSEGLQTKMKQELETLNTEQDDLSRIGKTLSFIRELIGDLKSFTRKYKFQSQAEEIQFFKEIKPIFLSQYFYYKKVFAIRLFDSFKDTKSKHDNHCYLLQQLEKYVLKNLLFYQYCMSGDTFMDAHYFTRQSATNTSPELDEHFTTGYDTKLSKILANELVRKYLFDRLNRAGEPLSSLVWTGSKTDLIELIYALHATDVFNKGSADIKLIAGTFENFFNISLGNYYRVFQEIRLRKTGQVNFLNQLRDHLLIRIGEAEK